MIPLSLALSGFLSYRDPVELDFTGFDLACIAGANGAGKSSLLDAITWALFGQARKKDESLINTWCNSAEVSFAFAYEENIYRVQRALPRGKTTILEFHILQGGNASQSHSSHDLPKLQTWKPLTERTIRETQAHIEQTLHLNYETFVNASFFLQGKADQFTQQNAGDRKRILSSILGLEAWEVYRQGAAERRKVVEAEITSIDGRLAEIQAELGEENTRKTRLAELEAELKRLSRLRASQEASLENIRKIVATLEEQRKLVESLARQLEGASMQSTEMQARLESRQKEKESYAELLRRAEEIENAYAAWQRARAELEQWERVASQFHQQEKKRQEPLTEIEARMARLSQEQQDLIDKKKQVEAIQGETSGLQSQLAVAKEAHDRAKSDLERKAKLESDLRSIYQRQAEAKAENPRLRAEMDEIKERMRQLSSVEEAECPVCGKPLTEEESSLLIAEMKALGTVRGDRFRENQAVLSDFDRQVKDTESQINALFKAEAQERFQARTIDQLNDRLSTGQSQVAEWDSKGAPRLGEIEQTLAEETFAPEARARLAEIDRELKAIGYDIEAHEAVRRAETEGRASETELRELEKARATLEPLGREIAELEAQAERQIAEVSRQKEEHSRAEAALAEAQAQAPDLLAAESELFNLQEQENRLRMEVGAARQKVSVLEELRKRSLAFTSQREALARNVAQFKQLERAFGKDGVPALLIEQALPQIEAKANEILDRLSGGNMSVRFSTQAAYKDKRREDRKETLDILIMDPAGTRDYEMFSGGEAFRVNFAIRLALSKVLAQRAGARLQTLVIDEGFGSQDAQGRQRMIEAINLVRQDFAKILVITHIDELKEAFPTRIEVDKTDRGSTVHIT